MNLTQIAQGSGSGLFGAVWYLLLRRHIRSDAGMRREAEFHWRMARRLERKVRRGLITKEEWLARYIRHQRANFRWVIPVLMLLWLLCSAATLVHGLDPALWKTDGLSRSPRG